MKQRIRIRLHYKIYDAIELEAAWQDSKVGTIANRILQEEFAQISRVGLAHCLCADADAPADAEGEGYYVLPSLDCREKYMPTHGRGLETKGQVTLMVTDEQREILEQLFARESRLVRGVYSESMGETVKSYRYQIVGMLLHNPLLRELQMQ